MKAFEGERGGDGRNRAARSKSSECPIQAIDSKGGREAVRFVRAVRFAIDAWARKLLESRVSTEGFPSGQREQTVNLPALPSKVRILPPPPIRGSEGRGRGDFGGGVRAPGF